MYTSDKNGNPFTNGTPIRTGDLYGSAYYHNNNWFLKNNNGEFEIDPKNVEIDTSNLEKLSELLESNNKNLDLIVNMEPSLYEKDGDHYINKLNNNKITSIEYAIIRNTCVNCKIPNDPKTIYSDTCTECGKNKYLLEPK